MTHTHHSSPRIDIAPVCSLNETKLGAVVDRSHHLPCGLMLRGKRPHVYHNILNLAAAFALSVAGEAPPAEEEAVVDAAVGAPTPLVVVDDA